MDSPQPPPSPPLSAAATILGKYQISRFLGRGSFAKVYQARSLIDGTTVAAKIIDKSKTVNGAMEPQIVREIDAMRRLQHHPNILRINEVMATKTKIYLIVEFAEGGELFSKIAHHGKMPELLARRYFQQLVLALCYCHHHGVAHRDLKPQNLLLDADGNLKVSDFGLSALPEQLNDGLLHTTCGTPAYTAPEILARRLYDGAKADAWSCGLILFVLLVGHLPFDETNILAMCKKIKNRDYVFPTWISKSARHIIFRLLDPNPKTRMKLDSLFENSWFKKSLKLQPKNMFGLSFNYEPISGLSLGSSKNAFDIISMSSGLDLRGLFETTSNEKREKSFFSNNKMEEVEAKVKEVGEVLGFKVELGKSGIILLEKGKVGLVFEVFEIVAKLLLVVVKMMNGGMKFEEPHLEDLKIGLHDIVLCWHTNEDHKYTFCESMVSQPNYKMTPN
ncbi:hypothetical protein Lal_00018537 [Lupinus albus]|uniref:non-specific serine/threonine protein kinase n=1 Tax=Lupinus albus TaxID=3870 RepID=A0A6A5PGL0_LUPAL|nr:putative protein kinase CAMK-CAMKL-CHK1 family [Lupinus albus]KAF1896258.1 hypothetical protein Lal_00018537 [Lupinus albus]